MLRCLLVVRAQRTATVISFGSNLLKCKHRVGWREVVHEFDNYLPGTVARVGCLYLPDSMAMQSIDILHVYFVLNVHVYEYCVHNYFAPGPVADHGVSGPWGPQFCGALF